MHNPPVILLVDDDAQIHDLYRTVFQKEGWTVVEAWNGEEGLKVAMKEKPDFILMDVMMPIMDGAKALLEIKKNPEYAAIKDIPLLILTSLDDKPVDARVAKEIGAVDFINKTIDFKELVKKVKAALQAK